MSALTRLTLAEARAGLAAGSSRRRELARRIIEAIEARAQRSTPSSPRRPSARSRWRPSPTGASPAARRRPLEGIPLAIKDLFCTEGIRTTAGSRILDGFVPPYELTVTANLWRAGAVLLGKTNLDEFAMGSSNVTSYFGPVVNPWTEQGAAAPLVPGGSSGGSAAAVAAQLCLGATGTDTGGSIRQPAALCGIVGMKPTYGRCSRFGIVAFASSLDQAGPLTRTVKDCAILLQQMAGYDPNDSTSADCPLPDLEAALTGDVRGLRIGIPQEYRIEGSPPEIDGLWQQGVAWLRAAGCEIREVSLPHTRVRAAGLLHRQPGRGVVQPRALRRHALWPAGRGQGPDRDLRADPRGGLRPGGAAARHDRHLRALGRLLRRLLHQGAEGPDQDPATSSRRRSSRSTCC